MSKETLESFKELERKAKAVVYKPLADLDAEMWWSEEPLSFADRMKGKYSKLKVGDCWGKLWDCAWFRFTGVVPAEAAGSKVVLLIDVGGEGCVFDEEGTPLRGLTCVNSEFDLSLGLPGKRVLQFLPCAAGGEKVDIWVEAGMNDLFGKYKNDGKLVEASIATCNDAARALYYDIHVLVDLYGSLDDGYRKDELAGILGRVNAILDEFTPEKMEAARKVLDYALEQKNSDAITFSAIGHAHIDLAWLWPIRETIRKGGRTFSTVLELMERYPEYKFGASQAQLYQWMKERYPKLYEKVKKRVADGRWEVQGALWVECDTNVSGAEAMVRQILYGKKFFREEFGVDVKTFWLPDAFGFSAAIPQLMKLSGTDYFTTIKMTWNYVNTFPYNTFIWKGLDGSSVLAHIPPEGTYNSSARPSALRKAEKEFKQKDISSNALMLFGIGDGGGGPGPEHLERIAREHDLDGVPRVCYEHAVDFFKRLDPIRPNLPVWRGEMYLENHQGTFTSQAKNKYYNRKLELALRQAEAACRMAELVTGLKYPEDELVRIWKEALLYQFHDILPGSSIKRVYDESCERYAVMLEEVNKISSGALTALADCIDTGETSAPAIAFNNTSWERTEWIKGENGWMKVNMPSMGYSVFSREAVENGSYSVSIQDGVVENDKVKVVLNDNGFIDSVLLKSNGMEMLREGCQGNVMTVHQDSGDAWNIDPKYLKLPIEYPKLVSRSTYIDGPKAVVRQTFEYGASRIEQDMVLVDGSARIDFVTRVDWHENKKMLRVRFPASIDVPEAACEIQFGHVMRPTHSNTSWDLAKFEVPHHRFADVSTPTAGLALLNNCKYGIRVHDCVLDLNLIRSTEYPGVEADLGAHEFTYALYPHEGDLVAGGVVREGYFLNVPVEIMTVNPHGGCLPVRNSLVAVSDENVVVESVKRSEDGKATVIRLYEASGAYRKSTVKLGIPAAEVKEVNLMEENPIPVEINKDSVELQFHPFEIKTLYVKKP